MSWSPTARCLGQRKRTCVMAVLQLTHRTYLLGQLSQRKGKEGVTSHRVLRSMRRNDFDLDLDLHGVRRNEELRSSTTPARQLHELNTQIRHIHLIEFKYCEDTRPCPFCAICAQTYLYQTCY
eukprot:1155415-Pelagomonas_calceolata.AAC.3